MGNRFSRGASHRISSGEAEARVLGTGIEDKKLTKWPCSEDLTLMDVTGLCEHQLLQAVVNNLEVNLIIARREGWSKEGELTAPKRVRDPTIEGE